MVDQWTFSLVTAGEYPVQILLRSLWRCSYGMSDACNKLSIIPSCCGLPPLPAQSPDCHPHRHP